jgi:hypothetical protein
MRVPFPVDGLVEGLPSVEQPPRTSFLLRNVRPFDVSKEKIRGGQRPGTVKAFTTQISGASHPVLYMTSITTTYITPE